MWEISVISQFNASLFSFFLGFLFAFEYYIVYEIFAYKRSNIAVFFSDIMFWVFVAIEYFPVFLKFSNGKIRLLSIVISAIGFYLFYRYFGFIRRFIRKIIYAVKAFGRRIAVALQRLTEILLKFLKKTRQLIKKVLIMCGKMMYTVLGKNQYKKR